MNIKEVTNFFGVTKDFEEPRDIETPKVLQEEQEPRKTLLEWKAYSRPNRLPIDQKKLRTFIIIGVVVCLLLLAMQEFAIILAVLALIFVTYMLAQTPADELNYKVTNQGMYYGERFYPWAEVKYFFFISKQSMRVLVTDTLNTLPGRVFYTLSPPADEQALIKLMSPYVNYLEEEPKTFMDKAYDSVAEKIDAENPAEPNNQ